MIMYPTSLGSVLERNRLVEVPLPHENGGESQGTLYIDRAGAKTGGLHSDSCLGRLPMAH